MNDFDFSGFLNNSYSKKKEEDKAKEKELIEEQKNKGEGKEAEKNDLSNPSLDINSYKNDEDNKAENNDTIKKEEVSDINYTEPNEKIDGVSSEGPINVTELNVDNKREDLSNEVKGTMSPDKDTTDDKEQEVDQNLETDKPQDSETIDNISASSGANEVLSEDNKDTHKDPSTLDLNDKEKSNQAAINEIDSTREISNQGNFPYDASKPFNQQQEPKFFPGRPLMEYLEEKLSLMEDELQYKLENASMQDINEIEDEELGKDFEALADVIGVDGISVGGKSLKKTQKKTKFQRPVSKEKLLKKGFPKNYYDPTDPEYDEATGKVNYFYNVENTLRNNNMLWLTKIIPLRFLEKITYDNSLFDAYADKQHNFAVKMNSMTAEDQYRFELRRKTMRIIGAFVFALMIVAYILFSKVPSNNYGKAVKMFQDKKWALSMEEFKNVGDYKESKTYYVYARAKLKQGNKDFDGALEDFEKILEKENAIDIDIREEIAETKYLKGVDLYTEHKYDDCIKTLREVEKHKEASEYINKAYYAIAEDHYNKSEYSDALDIFYALGKFSDSQERSRTIAEELYKKAMKNYQSSKYKEASEGFKLLGRYNYKNSKDMVNQVVYKMGLDSYLDGDYEEARNEFSNIIKYKDSDAMYKESTYNIAKKKYGDSVEASLEEFLKIRNYKDVPVFLDHGVFTLYGEWKIVEMNGEKSDELVFRFAPGGLLESEDDIMYAAISTEDNKIPYEWDGKEYSALDGEYKISTQRINGQTIVVIFKEGANSVKFTCIEEKDFMTMINKSTDVSIEEQEKTDNLVNLIQVYVDKKTDGETVVEQEKLN